MYILANISANAFMEQYLYMFIIALITLGLAVLLRSITAIVIQAALVLFFYSPMVDSNAVLLIMSVIQVILTIVVLYKVFQAITFNYTLVLEKKHELKPNYTVTLDKATRFSFWRTK